MKTSVLLLSLVSAFVLYKTAFFLARRFSNAKKAKQLGCLPAPVYPSPDPLGIKPVMDIIKSNTVGKLPEHLIWRFDNSSRKEGRPVYTFYGQFLRAPFFNTMDPKNIQALLATQFKDFELGAIRLGTFGPL